MAEKYKVYIIACKPSKHKNVLQFLKKNGFEAEPTIVSDYIIVFDKDPSDVIKKVFPNITVEEVNTEDESYIDILKSVQQLRSSAGVFQKGDPIRVIDADSPYYKATGIVEDIEGSTVKVTLTLWGIPYKVELPKSSLTKITNKF